LVQASPKGAANPAACLGCESLGKLGDLRKAATATHGAYSKWIKETNLIALPINKE
jgi:hypothetical protein